MLLLDAIRTEQYPDQVEKHFIEVQKRHDFELFRKSLPVFKDSYQYWYSSALAVVKFFLPDRLNDFTRLYEQPKNRRDVQKDNYTIEDYLKDVKLTGGYEGKKVIAGPADALPAFEQQLNILNSVSERFTSVLFDLRQMVQAELLDKELDQAELLLKNKCYRASGIICGLVLEKHLAQMCINHRLKPGRKTPSIHDYNDLLKKEEVYDFQTWRHIQILGDIRKLCEHAKNREPIPQEINDMIIGVDRVIRTVS
jgi:hypothetical protein